MRVLTLNAGSSSLKIAIYDLGDGERLVLRATAERIGGRSDLTIVDSQHATVAKDDADLPTHAAALERFLEWHAHSDSPVDAVGHRVVHGGRRYSASQRIDASLRRALDQLVQIDPDHMPQALSIIDCVSARLPRLPQVACFDTAFHRTMPRVAQRYALPARFDAAGIARYGFHGLSCEYVIHKLRELDPHEAAGRVIVAHLGNGASLTAVRDGKSVETTMGFSPAGGLVMGTRVGDIDPGVLVQLVGAEGLSSDALRSLVNRESGLLGVAETSGDMRDLLAAEESDSRAAAAIELFCYQASKFVGALTVAMGGLETLIFTGGIGEHATPIRARICQRLGVLGVLIDAERNDASAEIISARGSRVLVRILPTNEEIVIARHTRRTIAQS